jgi:hypothetical protein
VSRARGTLLVGLAAAVAGCVPRGDPPSGVQLVADRAAYLGGVLRPNGDGVTRVLVQRQVPKAAPYGESRFDLSVASVGPDAPPAERLLATNVQALGAGNCYPILRWDGFCSDARGRLLVMTGYDPMQGFTMLARIDPVTGVREDLGATGYYVLSPSGGSLLVFTDRLGGDATLYDAAGRAVVLDSPSSNLFIGEVLYYTTPQLELTRIAPGGAAERLATGIGFFGPATTEGTQLLMLARPTADPTVNTFSIFDTVTLEETPLPAGGTPVGGQRFELSPSGRWIVTSDASTGRTTLIERSTGAQEDVEIPAYQAGSYAWRPRHDELWFFAGSQLEPAVWIKKPGQPLIGTPGMPYALANDLSGDSMFTGDGAYWFSSRGVDDDFRPILQVGSADDPQGDRFDLAPEGTQPGGYWQLADGRIVTAAWLRNPDRSDLYAVDPMTGGTTVFGEAGRAVAVGQTRLLAILHVNDLHGDLTAVDAATGRATVLATEFALEAAVERSGADRVAPGAHVAFRFQARFDSPYDGIWVTTIP